MSRDPDALRRHAARLREQRNHYLVSAQRHRDDADALEAMARRLTLDLVDLEQQISRAAGTPAPFP